MAEKSRYIRRFIILENDVTEYLKSRNNKAKGYVMLECRDNKGKIIFNVDGLEAAVKDTEKIYKGILLTKHYGKPVEVEIGPIEVNEKGKGSFEWRFNPNSVGGTSVAIEDFKYVLIKLSSRDSGSFTIPLAGYINQKDGNLSTVIKELEESIKHNKIHTEQREIQNNQKLKTEQNNKIMESESEDTIKSSDDKEYKIGFRITTEEDNRDKNNEENQEEKQYETDEESEGIDETDYQKIDEVNFKKEDDGHIQTREEISDSKQLDNEEKSDTYQTIDDRDKENYFIRGKNADNQDNISYRNTDYNYEDSINNYGHPVSHPSRYMENVKDYSKHVANYSMNILKFFEKVKPFDGELDGYTWWEIEYDSKNVYRGFLPFYNYIVNIHYSYPFMTRVTTCQSLMKKYNHYIFGIYQKDNEIKYYVYGIPGRFTKEEQPYRGMTGFQTWIEKKGNDKEKLGYWLLHIDAVSGRIVNPLRPTPPRRFR